MLMGIQILLQFHSICKTREKHERPFSAARQFYIEMVNSGVEDEEAISHTMERFPTLKEEGLATVSSALSEVSKYISQKSTSSNQTSFITAVV